MFTDRCCMIKSVIVNKASNLLFVAAHTVWSRLRLPEDDVDVSMPTECYRYIHMYVVHLLLQSTVQNAWYIYKNYYYYYYYHHHHHHKE